MDEDLLDRLRRLGVVKGTRQLRPAPATQPENRLPPDPAPADDSETDLFRLLPGGSVQHTAEGECFVLDHVYSLESRHGDRQLGELLAYGPADAVPYLSDERFQSLSFRDFVFLDSETTGLWGAGVLAFMVGVAFFDGPSLVVRQLFLLDPADEPALLLLLEELLAERVGLITFNGRGFDVPLLDNRFLMNRMLSDIASMPHLDLLPPARRLWRNRLESCALGSLEARLLNVQRTQQDVEGALIPYLYREYLRTGDAREIARVFYHNRLDMLSMVTLATEVMQWLAAPPVGQHPLDLLGLARWQLGLGMISEAELNLRRAAVPELPTAFYHRALHELAGLLKHQERRQEAVQVWQQIAATSFEDVSAHVELAKHYEWHEREFALALQWTSAAMSLVERWYDPGRAIAARRELDHRLQRLARKAVSGGGPEGAEA